MKILKFLIVTLIISLMSSVSFGQSVTISGELGYSKVQGSAFNDAVTGTKSASAGISYDGDVLYQLEFSDYKLSVGGMYMGSAIVSLGSSSSGIYGLGMIGAKGLYRLNTRDDKKVSPFAGLSLGLSRLLTPDIIVNGVTTEGASSRSIGIRPEVGLDLAGFLISASYLVPMQYSITSDTGNFDGKAGSFTISIGYRLKIDL